MDQALKLFNEDDPSVLQSKMKEDALTFILMKTELAQMKVEKFELDRVVDRCVGVLDRVQKSTADIFGVCEAQSTVGVK